jgi:hypothetical protein
LVVSLGRRPRQCCTACNSYASPAVARLCTQQLSPAPLGPQGNQWQGPDPALHSALFVLLAAHLMPSFPPHYVVFQTEQWGHPLLAEGSAAWGPAHGGAARRDCGDVFRGAVEARHSCSTPCCGHARSVAVECCGSLLPCQRMSSTGDTLQARMHMSTQASAVQRDERAASLAACTRRCGTTASST